MTKKQKANHCNSKIHINKGRFRNGRHFSLYLKMCTLRAVNVIQLLANMAIVFPTEKHGATYQLKPFTTINLTCAVRGIHPAYSCKTDCNCMHMYESLMHGTDG